MNRCDDAGGDLLTSEEARTVRGEVRHKGSHFLWSSYTLNRRVHELQWALYQVQSITEIGTILTALPLSESVLAPNRAINSSTDGDVYPSWKC